MDPTRFAALSRLLGRAHSRRAGLVALLVGLARLAGIGAVPGDAAEAAAPCTKLKLRQPCIRGAACCSGLCKKRAPGARCGKRVGGLLVPTGACRCAKPCVPDNAAACAGRQCGPATNNCGQAVACGDCPAGQICVGAACGVFCAAAAGDFCPAGSAAPDCCAAGCTDTRTDAANCGACGAACPADQVCFGSACGVACPADPNGVCRPGAATPDWCATGCTNVGTDPVNCGRCGTVCPADLVCFAGRCLAPCPTDPSGVCREGQVCRDGLCRDP